MLESQQKHEVVKEEWQPGADNEVMTMYNKTVPIRVGDTITVNGAADGRGRIHREYFGRCDPYCA